MKPNYSIWITEESEENGTTTFDVNVWDEDENERAEELEQSRLSSHECAKIAIHSITQRHAESINFMRRNDRLLEKSQ